jgi:Ca2+-binding RTX toxin-like protein
MTQTGYHIVDANAVVAGQTVSQWTEEWWKWVYNAPNDNNPVYDDPTGAYAGIDNYGPVFFIPGAGSGTVERSFDVPANKPILLSPLNLSWVKFPADPSVDEGLDFYFPFLKDPYVRIDGKEIATYRLTERDFTLTSVEGNYLDSFDGAAVPPQTYPTGTDGYWVMLDGLTPGTHTLEAGGYFDWNQDGNADPDEGETLDVKTTINVLTEAATVAPLFASSGDDVRVGSAAKDLIVLLAGDDWAAGGAGNDTLDGGPGSDKLTGDAGADLFFTGSGDDTVRGGAGDDTASGASGNDDLFGEDGNDSLDGGAGDDGLYGGNGADTLDGGAGNDAALGGDGADLIDLGDGDDWAHGNTGNDTLLGGGGSDALYGDAGDDVLTGGPGADRIYTGSGNDTVVYTATTESSGTRGSDRVYDFRPGTGDRIDLSAIDARPDLPGDQAFNLVAADAQQWGGVWVFDHSWDDSTLVQGWVGPTPPSTHGDWFQFWIFDGAQVTAADYTAADFVL